MKLSFTKTEGCGNHFIIIDNREKAFDILLHNQNERTRFIQKICNPNFGVGADGIVFLNRHVTLDFSWEFFNNDGSDASMCGNASRCVALYYHRRCNGSAKGSFLSKASAIQFDVMSEDKIKIKMPKVKILARSYDEEAIQIIDSGVPHVTIEVPDVTDKSHLRDMAKKYRYPHVLDKNGANISFYSFKNNLESITFERGVEDFTLACGTGAVACAVSYNLKYKKPAVDIRLPGGKLHIDMDMALENIYMTGPARLVFDGEYTYDN